MYDPPASCGAYIVNDSLMVSYLDFLGKFFNFLFTFSLLFGKIVV